MLSVIVFRRPLADLLWPDSRIQQLLQRGDAALARGQLSAADGSGAREFFAAALALDGDRSEARQGLARTGAAAVVQARAALAAGDVPAAQRGVALARALEVAQAQIAPVELRLRQLQARRAGLDALVAQAVAAQQQGRLDGTPDSALPLYQRVLSLAPDRTDALEGREDALTDLLAQARHALARDALAEAAALLAAAKRYDAGHADVPSTEGQYHRLMDQRRQRADTLLRRGRLAPAVRDFTAVLAAEPGDAQAQRGVERVAAEYAAQATRQAADFQFDAATQSLQQARALVPSGPSIAAAEQGDRACARCAARAGIRVVAGGARTPPAQPAATRRRSRSATAMDDAAWRQRLRRRTCRTSAGTPRPARAAGCRTRGAGQPALFRGRVTQQPATRRARLSGCLAGADAHRRRSGERAPAPGAALGGGGQRAAGPGRRGLCAPRAERGPSVGSLVAGVGGLQPARQSGE
ncbi:conserved hypothetical protein [Xanthomonas campestris pv. campestris str. ATCC 33913]|uniref:Uncharacterized protein n=1 Tax=Xanthomonas campestris pv. campestris (strain ATCC 33913 / DSM 3586 / NCPPB 528 / LMG 568 / P 25) TaxID=190485 RepID=Q8P6N2_XANCP|nr:conserved hypothetical protein [Xanthomonas campestris pv. campestris str. ATCC 33913]